jgi:hypothetical protein
MIRPSETIAALTNAMARYLAMDAHVTPGQIDRGVARIAEHLRSLAVEMAGEPRTLMLPSAQGKGWLS